MDRRYIRIKNFRNIGIYDKNQRKDKEQLLYLNNSLNKKDMGELIIIVGENNVGKSNILDLIERFKSKKLSEDIPDFIDYDDELPEIELIYRENEHKDHSKGEIEFDKEYIYQLKLCDDKVNIKPHIYKYPPDTKNNDNKTESKEEIENNENLENDVLGLSIKEVRSKIDYIKSIIAKNREHIRITNELNENIEDIEKTCNDLISSDKNPSKKYFEIKNIYFSLKKFFFEIDKYYQDRHLPNTIVFDFKDLDTINNSDNKKSDDDNKYNDIHDDSDNKEKEKEIENYIKEKYDINMIPNIFYYEDNIIKKADLTVKKEEIIKSEFFKSLLNSIGEEVNIINDAYEKSKRNPAIREQYQNRINEKIKNVVNKKFNELYYNLDKSNQIYCFNIYLGDIDVSLYTYKYIDGEKQAIDLDKQSVGFKWFFNLFFNFLHKDLLNAGDIVLMDEPDAHLSLPARRDLRKFLKDFARQHGVTFVVATHNPSLIDVNFLDEIRIIKHKEKGVGVEIVNEFTAINKSREDIDKVDTLEDIINGFGVLHRDIITNPNNKVIFVEGITDYNYLTAFKVLREYEENKNINLAFLPINGLGKEEKKESDGYIKLMKNTIKKLSRFKNAIILTDGDYAGEKFNELNTNYNLNSILLSEIIPNVKVIEDLFSSNDKNNNSNIKNKLSRASSLLKNTIVQNKDNIDLETKKNFYKIFDYFLNYKFNYNKNNQNKQNTQNNSHNDSNKQNENNGNKNNNIV